MRKKLVRIRHGLCRKRNNYINNSAVSTFNECNCTMILMFHVLTSCNPGKYRSNSKL